VVRGTSLEAERLGVQHEHDSVGPMVAPEALAVMVLHLWVVVVDVRRHLASRDCYCSRLVGAF
jgi:hypothetical protein